MLSLCTVFPEHFFIFKRRCAPHLQQASLALGYTLGYNAPISDAALSTNLKLSLILPAAEVPEYFQCPCTQHAYPYITPSGALNLDKIALSTGTINSQILLITMFLSTYLMRSLKESFAITTPMTPEPQEARCVLHWMQSRRSVACGGGSAQQGIIQEANSNLKSNEKLKVRQNQRHLGYAAAN